MSIWVYVIGWFIVLSIWAYVWLKYEQIMNAYKFKKVVDYSKGRIKL